MDWPTVVLSIGTLFGIAAIEWAENYRKRDERPPVKKEE